MQTEKWFSVLALLLLVLLVGCQPIQPVPVDPRVPVDAAVDDEFFFVNDDGECMAHIDVEAQPRPFPLQVDFYLDQEEKVFHTESVPVPDKAEYDGYGVSFVVPCETETVKYVMDPIGLVAETDENNEGLIQTWNDPRPAQ